MELIWFSQNKGCDRLNVGNHLEKNLVHFIYVRYKLLNVQVDIILLNIATYMVQMTIHAKATGFGFVKKIFHEASWIAKSLWPLTCRMQLNKFGLLA